MSQEYYENNKGKWDDFYIEGLKVCPLAKMFRELGLFCPWQQACSRHDRGKHFECRRR